jgi:ribosomal protein L37E
MVHRSHCSRTFARSMVLLCAIPLLGVLSLAIVLYGRGEAIVLRNRTAIVINQWEWVIIAGEYESAANLLKFDAGFSYHLKMRPSDAEVAFLALFLEREGARRAHGRFWVESQRTFEPIFGQPCVVTYRWGRIRDLLILSALPLAAAVGSYMWSSIRARRRRSHGCCQRCGYNLTGNVSGVCPECGTPGPKDVDMKQIEEVGTGETGGKAAMKLKG